MAAPSQATVHDLTGQWKFNHGLSDDIGALMAVQGVNLLVRTALSRAPITLDIEHVHNDAAGSEMLKTKQYTMGRTTEEERVLNWEEVATAHPVFGEVKTKIRINSLEQVAHQLLKGSWEDGTAEVIEVQSHGQDWKTWQAWGFEVIDGTRYHVRRVVAQKESGDAAEEPVVVRMVYDYIHQ